MNVVLGVLAAAAALTAPLPGLPAEGVAISDARGVRFVDLMGRRLGAISGMHFSDDQWSGLPRLVDARGRFWAVDRTQRRLVPAARGQVLYGGATLAFVRPVHTWIVRNRAGRMLMRIGTPGETLFVSEHSDVVTSSGRALDLRTQTRFGVPRACDVAGGTRPRWILLCRDPHYRSRTPRTIEEIVRGRRLVIAGPPGKQPAPNTPPLGHWAGVRLSPDGDSLLAQWSAECETPVVYVISRRTHRATRLGASGDESVALGWTHDGRAVVHFPAGSCGGTYRLGAGVYAVSGERKQRIVATKRPQRVAFWP